MSNHGSQAKAALLSAAEEALRKGSPAQALTILDRIPSAQCDLSVLRLRFITFALSSQWELAFVVGGVAMDLFGEAADIARWLAESVSRYAPKNSLPPRCDSSSSFAA